MIFNTTTCMHCRLSNIPDSPGDNTFLDKFLIVRWHDSDTSVVGHTAIECKDIRACELRAAFL